jgi:arginine utilization regulatory protein
VRVLQEGRFRRVGGSVDIKVNIRILSSLNTDPNKAVADGVLRQDLFYRLAVVAIRIPPLNERKDDIPMLTSFFIGKHNYKLNKSVKNICPDVMKCFLSYNWPGNVRELEHVLECAMVVMGDGSYIKLEHLPQHLIEGYAQQQDEQLQSGNVRNLVILDNQLNKLHYSGDKGRGNPVLKHKMDNTEKDLIIDILGKTKGNVSKTARILGISRQSLQYRMKKYSINREELSL